MSGIPLATMLGLVCLTMAIIWVMPKITRTIPAPLAGIAVVAALVKLGQLSQKNDDRQAVYKPKHNRVWHKTDKLAEMKNASEHLQDAHQDDSRKQIFNPVACHQGHHHDGKRSSRARNHCGSASNTGRNQPNKKGGIETDKRIDARNKRKRHSFGHQSKGNCKAGK